LAKKVEGYSPSSWPFLALAQSAISCTNSLKWKNTFSPFGQLTFVRWSHLKKTTRVYLELEMAWLWLCWTLLDLATEEDTWCQRSKTFFQSLLAQRQNKLERFSRQT
jgi:hypothetical protein